jgi:FAD/FMN-containing dehydrogenase
MAVQDVTVLSPVSLDNATIEAFGTSLRGELLRPGDEGYDAARMVHNGMIDKHPALIARCAGATDVMRAVAFAREHQLLMSVRGGGHNVTGNAVSDGGLMIDLTPMKGLRIDPVSRTARCEAGLTWGEVNHDAQIFDLAATGGFVGTTGVAGLTLGGGLGWLLRKHGLACDNLLSADVVTADGQFLTANEEQNADLFWGLRGGGGNFGVVTSFEFRLHPAGMVLAGPVIHPLAHGAEVLRFYRDFTAMAPEELTSGALFATLPDVGPVVAIGFVYTGPIAEGEAVVRPLRAFGSPVADAVQPMPYSAAQTMVDAFWPRGLQNYWKSTFLTELSDAAIDTLVTHFATVPSPQTVAVVEHFGGAMRRIAPEASAFPHRQWDYDIVITSMWSDPAEAERNIAWTREFSDVLQPFTPAAVYVNYLGVEGEERVRAAYGVNYDRLVALKNQYDPTNLFRLNQNVAPTV